MHFLIPAVGLVAGEDNPERKGARRALVSYTDLSGRKHCSLVESGDFCQSSREVLSASEETVQWESPGTKGQG